MTGKSALSEVIHKMNLNGQVAIVTGGGTGVGQATSLKLAAEGCTVIVSYSRSKKEAAETVNTILEAGGRAYPPS